MHTAKILKFSKHIFIKKIASFSCFENPRKNRYRNQFMIIHYGLAKISKILSPIFFRV